MWKATSGHSWSHWTDRSRRQPRGSGCADGTTQPEPSTVVLLKGWWSTDWP